MRRALADSVLATGGCQARKDADSALLASAKRGWVNRARMSAPRPSLAASPQPKLKLSVHSTSEEQDDFSSCLNPLCSPRPSIWTRAIYSSDRSRETKRTADELTSGSCRARFPPLHPKSVMDRARGIRSEGGTFHRSVGRKSGQPPFLELGSEPDCTLSFHPPLLRETGEGLRGCKGEPVDSSFLLNRSGGQV